MIKNQFTRLEFLVLLFEILLVSTLRDDYRAEDVLPYLGAVRLERSLAHDREVGVVHAVVVDVLLDGHQSLRVPDLVVDDDTLCGALKSKTMSCLGLKLLSGNQSCILGISNLD